MKYSITEGAEILVIWFGISVGTYHALPPLDERDRNNVINRCTKIGLHYPGGFYTRYAIDIINEEGNTDDIPFDCKIDLSREKLGRELNIRARVSFKLLSELNLYIPELCGELYCVRRAL